METECKYCKGTREIKREGEIKPCLHCGGTGKRIGEPTRSQMNSYLSK